MSIVERGRGIGKEGVPEGGINGQYPGQIPTCAPPIARIPQPSRAQSNSDVHMFLAAHIILIFFTLSCGALAYEQGSSL